MRALSIISGIGLGIIWLISLGNPSATPWMTWLICAGAVLSFIVAGVTPTRPSMVGGPLFVSLGLFALWIVGLSANVVAYQNWWTFAFACLMLVAAAVGGTEARNRLGGTVTDAGVRTGSDRFRRSA